MSILVISALSAQPPGVINCIVLYCIIAVTVTGYVMSSRQMSCNASSMLSSSAFGASSLGIKRKHVRFNNKVEQYVAVESNGKDNVSINSNPFSDSTSDDGLTMKRLRPRKRAPPIRRKSND
jgi:hypothetical protein